MSSYPYPPGPGTGYPGGTVLNDDAPSAISSTDVTQDQAAGVRGTAAQAGRQVAGTAKDQAGEVVSEARDQARALMDRTRSEVGEQAATQQQRAADSLRSLSGELRSMADGQQEPGMATDLARQAADKAGQLASWLSEREPGDVVAEVSRFARRRPGTFLAVATAAGVLAGRLTRGLAAGTPGGPGDRGGSTSARHLAGMGSTTDLTGMADTEASGTRPFTRAGDGLAGPPRNDVTR
jgi:uncharacterized protein YjbJ (UPF0337 family)